MFVKELGAMRSSGRHSVGLFVAVVALLGAAALGDTIVVDTTSSVQWLANPSDPGLGETWTQSLFDDSSWTTGSYGIGYDNSGNASGLLATTVPNTSVSVYTRTTFNLAGAGSVGNVYLGVDYDDGWALWINGTEVARSPNMPGGPLDWNTPAGDHESSNFAAPFYEWFDVSSTALALLGNGTNTVALGVWNTGAGSSDLVLAPILVLDKTPQLTRAPYLQRGTHDTMVLNWRTDIPTDSEVLCGTTQGSLGICLQDATPVMDHALELTGLTADTDYWYAVGSIGTIFAGNDPDHRFRTAPLPGVAKPTRVWIIGDSGTADIHARDVRDAYQTFTIGTPTDVWLMLGDNAYNGGTDLEYQAAVFDIYPELLRRTVLWPTFGNHDAVASNAVSRSGPYFSIFDLPAAAEAGGVASGTEVYYSFDYGNIHFVVLDSQTSDRTPGSTMLTWLEADLAATAQDWLVAYWHHAPYSKGSHDSDTETRLVEMRENVVPILEDYGVDLVFTGHSHAYERSFLIDGHYGDSDTFTDGMKVDLGDGDEAGNGAYQKPIAGPDPHRGTVYTVSGNAGQLSGGSLDHPANLVSFVDYGSVVLDVNGLRADVVALDDSGVIRDRFTMTKGMTMLPPVAQIGADPLAGTAPLAVRLIDRSRNVPNMWQWDFENDSVVDSTLESPMHTYTVPGIYSVALAVANANGADQTVAADLICVTAGIPEPVQGLLFDTETDFHWSAAGGAGARYDVVRGDVGQLRAGNLGASQQACPVADTPATSASDPAPVAPGAAAYYLVRARNCAGESGTFDSMSTAQLAPRDVDLQGAGAVCGCGPGEDGDGDGYCANLDNCPGLASADLTDTDADGRGDLCDACPNDSLNDIDLDGVCGDVDNCPTVADPLQLDFDTDLIGDVCDPCTDGDQDTFGDPGFPANTCAQDNCPAVANMSQANDDGDAFGNICDICPNDADNDIDLDGICGDVDNCVTVANAGQLDADVDLVGDACDTCTDLDGDGAGDDGFPANTCPLDNCPGIPNMDQANADNDLLGDVCDSCPIDPGNDFDADGLCADMDNCPVVSNPLQLDDDGDTLGNACDPCPADPLNDIDGDFVCGDVDNCPADANTDQFDFDGDLLGDACDPDDDNDGTSDAGDCAPFNGSLSQPAGPTGNNLRIDETGGATLTWLRGDQGHVNNVYRAVRAVNQPYDGTFACLVPESPARNAIDAQGPMSAMVFYYLVSTRNTCGESAAGFATGGAPVLPAPACPGLFADFDSDGREDLEDNCPLAANPAQTDGDADFVGDLCDNCPADPNPDQADSDGNMVGDACSGPASESSANSTGSSSRCPVGGCSPDDGDPGDVGNTTRGICPNDPDNDIDGDGICGDVDNCPTVANPMQLDADNDLFGDVCDGCPLDPANDFDRDGMCANADNCPYDTNGAQIDGDGDGLGNACDPCPLDPLNDLDGDFVCGDADNCPADANTNQLDADGDLLGDACDSDDDNDGTADADDCAPFNGSLSRPPASIGETLQLVKNGATELTWLRGDQGHVSNLYRAVRAINQPYSDTYGCLLPESPVPGASDAQTPATGMVFCYLVSTRNACGESAAGYPSAGPATQPGPACPGLFADFDGDGRIDLEDNCPLVANPVQIDGDGDFVGDLCDNCTAVPNPDQADGDGDTVGDACE